MSTMPRRNAVPEAFNLRRLYPSSTSVPLGTDHRHLDSCGLQREYFPHVLDAEDRPPVDTQHPPRKPHHRRVAADRWTMRSAQSLPELAPRTPVSRPREKWQGARQWPLAAIRRTPCRE